MNNQTKRTRLLDATRLTLGAVLSLALVGTAGARGLLKEPPAWAAQVKSTRAQCTEAANEARNRALAQGVDPSRMQWLYGKKPFEKVGHVSLVIDGWIVVDNGGLGRNMWGDAICRGNVCTVGEARRGLEQSFLESSSLALREEFAAGEWAVRVAASGE
jgi:hypothetical protein